MEVQNRDISKIKERIEKVSNLLYRTGFFDIKEDAITIEPAILGLYVLKAPFVFKAIREISKSNIEELNDIGLVSTGIGGLIVEMIDLSEVKKTYSNIDEFVRDLGELLYRYFTVFKYIYPGAFERLKEISEIARDISKTI